jgi:hypothetical protein
MPTPDEFTVATARAAAEHDDLADWVAAFLASPGSDNAELAAELRDPPRWWLGPVQLRFDELRRLAGPPDQPTLTRLHDDDLEVVEEMADSLDEGWDPPPLIVTWKGDHLMLEDGNHRVEGMRRTGEQQAWCVVAFTDRGERDRWIARADQLRTDAELS